MPRSNKHYQKSIEQLTTLKLKDMQAFGESKREGKQNREAAGKIYSFTTYKTYLQWCIAFAKYIMKNHPECTTLKAAKRHIKEWLQGLVDGNYSAWTVQTAKSAVCKLYGIKVGDDDYFICPERKRSDIKRSRVKTKSDRHFSKTNNDELIRFCKGTGLRQEGVKKLRGKSLKTKAELNTEYESLRRIPKDKMTKDEYERYIALKNAEMFDTVPYFLEVVEKGGKLRFAPIIGEDTEAIITRMKATKPDDHVWENVPKAADIHSYRAEYCTAVYKKYARPIDKIPFDRINKGTGKKYQSEVYVCRGDEVGRKLDKRAMMFCSKALGHNRNEIISRNYLRGI